MAYDLNISLLANGRLGKATVELVSDDGKVFHTDETNLMAAQSRGALVRRLARKLSVAPKVVAPLLEDKWNEAVTSWRQKQAAPREVLPPDAADPPSGSPYRMTDHGILWDKPTAAGAVGVRLTNFTARIVSDVAHDDGAEVRRHFEVEAALKGRTERFVLGADRFAAMNWPPEYLGAEAIVYPGLNARDHARCAIQTHSGAVPTRHVYRHTGFRQMGGEWVYLHGGGGIGPNGPVPATVELPAALAPMGFSELLEGEDLAVAVRASLRVLDLGPDRVTGVTLGAAYRAPLGDCDCSLHLAGPSGVFKTELAALAQQHYGAGFDSRNLPGNWSSTGNATEGLMFYAKDMPFVVDDFAPGGSTADQARLYRDADRIFRNTGNRSARQRMQADGSLRPDRPPRSLPISTGEEIPRGHSCRARVVIVEVSQGTIDRAKLSECQADARAGLYAAALAGFVRWLAPRYDEVRKHLPERLAVLRSGAGRQGRHRRTASNLAQLQLGWDWFLDFCEEAGAVGAAERWALADRVCAALEQAADAQHEHHQDAEPAGYFLRLLKACITSGRAHVANPQGGEPPAPDQPQAWGWKHHVVGAGANERWEWQPQGRRVGWVDGEQAYLDPDAAHAEAQKLATEKGEPLAVSSRTLGKRLHEKGHLLESDEGHLTVRRDLEGRRQRVWCLSASWPLGAQESGPNGPTGPDES